ncbi:MAG: hypothetical protein M1834_009553 [Cirrosporium novae-zelandiae]|nr:MAG: hypothetical protein M1834_009553 [Cirrosporium novae-zelandiae]
MHSISIFSLLLAAGMLVSARPSAPGPILRRELSEDDIILFSNDGRVEVMAKEAYFAELSASNVTVGPPDGEQTVPTEVDGDSEEAASTNETLSRRCSSYKIFKNNAVSNFLNWDVPMSSVVHATGGTNTIAVTAGYQISNSLGVSESADFTIVKDYLSASYGITYTQTWTSTYAAAYTFTIPSGKYGAVVSNPKTVRHSGSVSVGCVGSWSRKSTFQGDSYSSKAYGGLSWVDGTISLCTGNSYPLPRCIGSGTIS